MGSSSFPLTSLHRSLNEILAPVCPTEVSTVGPPWRGFEECRFGSKMGGVYLPLTCFPITIFRPCLFCSAGESAARGSRRSREVNPYPMHTGARGLGGSPLPGPLRGLSFDPPPQGDQNYINVKSRKTAKFFCNVSRRFRDGQNGVTDL